jgi:multidrug efflux pump subunit AcrA (membrane-fusion protein)
MKLHASLAKFTVLFLLASLIAAGTTLLLSGCGRAQAPAATAGAAKTLYTCGMHPQVVQDKPGNCPICGMKLQPLRKQATSSVTATASDERRILYYKSTMMPGETNSAPAKDSMGMDMAPVYEAAGPGANAGAPAKTGERKIKYYKSTMTPGEVRQTPGKDTMGMEMVPVYEDEAAAAQSQQIAIDPVTTQNMGIRTAVVTRGPLRRTIRTVGTIDYNETALEDVTTKFKGWIEKLHVNATGQLVMRGDPLFEIYSPELYSAQREYLLVIEQGTNASDGASLKTSALTKLKFFDISPEQIAELERTGQPSKTLRILAPMDGFVVEKMVVQGQMVEPGMKIYRLADLGLVWVQAQIYEQDLAYVKLGQEATVTLSYLPDREFRGRVTYIYPNVDEKTRTARVRMEFHNPGYFLKPGMFATVQVSSELEASVLLVPDMAILRSGEKNTVFVALDGGKFEPRTLVLGPQAANDMYQVISGLKEGERIVTSGQFMLDSESQLREAIQKMLEPKKPIQTEPAKHAGHDGTVGSHEGTNAAAPSAEATTVKYICPMPEHVSIQYDHPGKCSICGMTLVPVSGAALKRLQPGGRLLYYTCPMPEDSDVRSDKPGKCPKCGMTLIPVMQAPPLSNAATNPATAEKTQPLPATLYTCPMASHADVVSDKPGKCPKCEMELVPTSTVSHGKVAEENWRKQHPGAPSSDATMPQQHQH